MQVRNNDGLFIGFIGVPGVGKSTLASALAKKLQAEVFIEPGEDHWPVDAATWIDHVNEIEEWLCKTNAEYFRAARNIADAGGKAIADGGIFLINSKVVDSPEFGYWYGHLNQEQKQYFYQQGLNDWVNAACPDILVLIETDKNNWIEFLKIRGRGYDSNEQNIVTYDAQKSLMRAAATEFAKARGIQFIHFNNVLGNPEKNVDLLISQLGIEVN